MILNIKNYSIRLINIFFIIFLLSCNLNTTKNINWIDLTEETADGPIQLDFRTYNNNLYSKKLICNKTKRLNIQKASILTGKKHDSAYMSKIYPCAKLDKTKIIEIFLFPCRKIQETSAYYVVPKLNHKLVTAYYIEAWDEQKEMNYYIFSNDNFIEKIKPDCDKIYEIDYVANNLNEDKAFYIKQEQILKVPFNGFIVKSEIDGTNIFLSTLWD